MEDNFISNSNIEAITNKLEEQYDLINDWKFISIVQFGILLYDNHIT